MKFLLFLFSIIIPIYLAMIHNPDGSSSRQKGTWENITTHFTFTAKVQCSILKNWCVQLEYMESDVKSPNDPIVESPWYCSDNYQQIIETRGTQIGDGVRDPYYELYVRVRHNCRRDEKFVMFIRDLPQVPTELRTVPVIFSINMG